MALINQQELLSKFMFDTYPYGQNPRWWPHSTILLCRCLVISNGIQLQQSLTRSPLGGVWQRFDNVIEYKIRHAEEKMIEYLSSNLDKILPTQVVHLRVFLSYSPCCNCATNISKFKTALQIKNIESTIEIIFSNFYKCSNIQEKNNQLGGLCQLVLCGIRLGVFYGVNDWNNSIHYVVGLPLDYTCIDAHSAGRQEREYIDLCIIHCIAIYSKTGLTNPAVDLLPVARARTYAEANTAMQDLKYPLPLVLVSPLSHLFSLLNLLRMYCRSGFF
ncbi:uncharacterized protein LOC128558832 [Mercenaria mercenaria]|uniref:uncharacterized protein LOC128558832 n=1 Tax=Mercenaria mercenaria TaxID=6596 RepID=UPI00234E8BE7|nr:uncharacterized protein LOC128558832 [Mercenaria mercenaria]